ncbi:hypothetical protein Patl1_07020 [Pistacia atlantica]|uniref:Uncharacterized protein n=1 Tax=Pistacia atlantica TaxID=434234 RepID=A0ACC1AIN7_9ROSI|nr:hypothetical protein Patl1_07020 [Pistacia atlantica]
MNFGTVVQHMMYGARNDPNSLPETLALEKDIVVEYVTDLMQIKHRILA